MLILRYLKVGGTYRYTDEVAAGQDFIRENEVDGDFDNIYLEFNGGIDNDNILVSHPGPRIVYEKLDLTGKLQGSDFDPTSTTTLPPGVYGPNTIPGAALVDGSITLAKIGVGQSVAGIVGQHRQDTVVHSGAGDERLYLEYTWTSRSGFYLVLSALHVVFGVDQAAPPAGYAMNVKLDGTAGSPADGTILGSQWFQDPNSVQTGTAIIPPATLTLGVTGFALSPGVHRIKVSGYPFSKFVGYAHIDSGWSTLVEFA